MAKYYVILVVLLVAVLAYVFLNDPCNSQFRADFAGKFPDYKILDSGSREGSTNEVQCYIYYEKPANKQVHKDIWLYRNSDSGWSFASVLESGQTQPAP